eukprot:CAMPEP_0182510072 /NCGR_PEP_ID=MMETSP1321-20130603/27965_1 /TAXON_ID=91990 /ORGANISM="Bolidomonas sp., Strain RCC1657" /LENGTH=259 /DNA_ID=CAMNT_0024716477 /DNA_START=194 /DNA_END=970 /DNA_ORIENTATION=-
MLSNGLVRTLRHTSRIISKQQQRQQQPRAFASSAAQMSAQITQLPPQELTGYDNLASLFPGVPPPTSSLPSEASSASSSDSVPDYSLHHPSTLLSSILLKKQNLTSAGSKRYRNLELQSLSTSISHLSKTSNTLPYNNELYKYLPNYPLLTRTEFNRVLNTIEGKKVKVHVDLDALTIILNRLISSKIEVTSSYSDDLKESIASDKSLLLSKIDLLTIPQLEKYLSLTKSTLSTILSSKTPPSDPSTPPSKTTYRLHKW